MVPRPGEAAGEWWDTTGQAQARAEHYARAGLPLPADFDPAEAFFHDVPSEVVEQAMAMGEQAVRFDTLFSEPWPLPAWPLVPTRFLQARDDRFFPLEFQRRVVAERLGIPVDDMPGGHSSRSAGRRSSRSASRPPRKAPGEGTRPRPGRLRPAAALGAPLPRPRYGRRSNDEHLRAPGSPPCTQRHLPLDGLRGLGDVAGGDRGHGRGPASLRGHAPAPGPRLGGDQPPHPRRGQLRHLRLRRRAAAGAAPSSAGTTGC